MNEPLITGLRPVSEDKEDESIVEGEEEAGEENMDRTEQTIVTRTDSVNSSNARRFLAPQTTQEDWQRKSFSSTRSKSRAEGEMPTPTSSVCESSLPTPGWRAAGTVKEVHDWWLRQLEIDSDAD